MRRRSVHSLLTLCLLFLCGCGSKSPAPQQTPQSSPTAQSESDPYADAKKLLRELKLDIVPVQSSGLAADGWRGSVVLFAEFDVRTAEVEVYPPIVDPASPGVRGVLAPISAAIDPHTATLASVQRWLRAQLRSPEPVDGLQLLRGQRRFVVAVAVDRAVAAGRYSLLLPFTAPLHTQRLLTPLYLTLEVGPQGVTLIAPTDDRTDLSKVNDTA